MSDKDDQLERYFEEREAVKRKGDTERLVRAELAEKDIAHWIDIADSFRSAQERLAAERALQGEKSLTK